MPPQVTRKERRMTHIHSPQSWTGRSVQHCRRCKRKRRHVVTFYEWYEPRATCCTCGSVPYGVKDDEARQLWPTLPHWRVALREMTEAIR